MTQTKKITVLAFNCLGRDIGVLSWYLSSCYRIVIDLLPLRLLHNAGIQPVLRFITVDYVWKYVVRVFETESALKSLIPPPCKEVAALPSG